MCLSTIINFILLIILMTSKTVKELESGNSKSGTEWSNQ